MENNPHTPKEEPPVHNSTSTTPNLKVTVITPSEAPRSWEERFGNEFGDYFRRVYDEVTYESLYKFINSELSTREKEVREEADTLANQWLGYFEDIVDDAKTLEEHYVSKEKPEWLGMIQGLRGPATQGITSIKHWLTTKTEGR